ncbi:MAG: ATP-grasp domain-containing protein [Verrucomicrobiae bacterium]
MPGTHLDSQSSAASQLPQTWIIVESLVGAGIINLLRDRPSIRVVTKDELQGNPGLRIKKGDKVIIATETVLDEALNRLDDDEKKEMVSRLKNKVTCRQMLTSIFPDFFFREIPVRDLPRIELDPDEKYFVKPIKGYWGSAAFPLDAQTDRVGLMHEIEAQLAKRTNLFSEQVVSKDRLIVEEFLEGEEYAVDMFFNESGQPVITNVCHHPLPKKRDYLHVVYYTSHEVYRNLYPKFIEFFQALNQSLQARSIPIHGEFKLHKGKLTPIELNPLRFGSDGFADLSFHAFGFNPFLYFAENRAPDWEALWKGREEKIFAFYLGYNGSDLDTGHYRPDFHNFRRLFSHILSDTAMNYQDTLAFAVMYIEEDSLERIHELLGVEFNEYFVDLKQYSQKSYQELYRAGTERKLAPGQILWKADDPGDYLVLILQGELEVFLPGDHGEILLETYGPGAVVGELSAIDGLPRSATVRAKTRGKVMKISGSIFRELIQRTPDILEDLFWQQVNRVRKLNHELTNMRGRGNTPTKP